LALGERAIPARSCSPDGGDGRSLLRQLRRPARAVTLDIDDTLDVVHGHQQLSFFNAHYDERCFLPIHIYDTATARPVAVILHAGWLYLRFTLSYRDVEELLAERGLDLSYESVRSWVLKFGPAIARGLRRCRPRPSDRWHLDEMVVRIAGKHMYLWRAVDHEGEVLEILVQRRRDRSAAVKLMRKLLRKQGFAPTRVTTDKLRSYGAAFRHLGLSCHH